MLQLCDSVFFGCNLSNLPSAISYVCNFHSDDIITDRYHHRIVMDDNQGLIDIIRSLTTLICRDKHTLYIYAKTLAEASFISCLVYGYVDNIPYENVIEELLSRTGLTISDTKYIKMLKEHLKPYHFYNTKFFCSNFSDHKVFSTHFQKEFHNSESLFQAYKDPSNQKYVTKLAGLKTAKTAHENGQKINLRHDWKDDIDGFENRFHLMIEVLEDKKNSNKDEFYKFKEQVGLRPIINYIEEKFWGANRDYSGNNELGRAWKIILIMSEF
jgi:hypothetical protein